MDAELLRQALCAALDDPNGVLATIRDELRMARQANADGRPFTMIAAGVVAADGTFAVNCDGPRVGQVWHVERVAVTIAGANAAALAQLYLDSPAADVDLLDFANAMVGNTPSRLVFAAPGGPYLIPNGTPMIVAGSGAIAASAISVRFQGRVVEVDVSGGKV